MKSNPAITIQDKDGELDRALAELKYKFHKSLSPDERKRTGLIRLLVKNGNKTLTKLQQERQTSQAS